MASSSSSEADPYQPYRPRRRAIDDFGVLWSRPTQRFGAVIKTFWDPGRQDNDPYFQPFMGWILGRRNRTLQLGDRFRDLFFAKLDIPYTDEWYFKHALGRGGFGTVGCFERRDGQTDVLTDELAVKTTESRPHEAIDDDREDLSIEAALLSQTNDLNEDGMVFLREFKFYPDDLQWRYYFEYCPYGDLERIRMRYKAYGRHFPELFLWHVFFWLARTAREYTDYNDWRFVTLDYYGDTVPKGFLLHCDIKPQNVFLGPSDPDLMTDETRDMCYYPIPRIADLGLAVIASPFNPHNQAGNLRRGTRPYVPPECRFYEMNHDTSFYPFGSQPGPTDDPNRKGHHQLTSKANIWPIGAIMFELLTLQDNGYLHRLVQGILDESFDEPAPGVSIIPDNASLPILYNHSYSPALCDLIRNCLCHRPEDRYSEDRLLELTRQGYLRQLSQVRQRAGLDTTRVGSIIETSPNYKVYYYENEIDKALDNYRWDHITTNDPASDRLWWERSFLRDLVWIPPSWGTLWPDSMPDDVVPPDDWPVAYQTLLRDNIELVRRYRAQAWSVHTPGRPREEYTNPRRPRGPLRGPGAPRDADHDPNFWDLPEDRPEGGGDHWAGTNTRQQVQQGRNDWQAEQLRHLRQDQDHQQGHHHHDPSARRSRSGPPGLGARRGRLGNPYNPIPLRRAGAIRRPGGRRAGGEEGDPQGGDQAGPVRTDTQRQRWGPY